MCIVKELLIYVYYNRLLIDSKVHIEQSGAAKVTFFVIESGTQHEKKEDGFTFTMKR